MDFAEQRTCTSTAFDVSVRVDVEFEHHMGASVVHLMPSVPVGGINHFWTHNGNAGFSADGQWLFLHDATLLICCDLQSGRCLHEVAPRGQFFTQVYTEAGMLCRITHDPGGMPGALPQLPLDGLERHLSQGLGTASQGRFPSA